MRAIIVANGSVAESESYAEWVRRDDLVIAADGGARIALQLGLEPQVVIGDMDSVPPELRAHLAERGCQFLEYPARKDETDTELAIHYVLQAGAQEIVLLGATGDRLDHTLANIFLLGMPALAGVKCSIVTRNSEVWLLRGGDELEMHGHPGDIVTLLPLGQDAAGIHTDGLEWALHDETLRFGPARGISNVMAAGTARVRLRAGLLLVLRVRHAEVEGAEMTEENTTENTTDLVEVRREQGHLRANVIKSKLEAAGIPAMLAYEALSRIYGLTVDGIGEVRIMVRAEDAEEARRLLAEEHPAGEEQNGN